MILVSACLVGECCKYSGGHNRNEAVIGYLENKDFLPFCPETAGGLAIPRPPAEISGGDGMAVLRGEAQVSAQDGRNLSPVFLQGAEQALALCRRHGIVAAILKERSPSCGVHEIYDGSFQGRKKPGRGVTAALLHQQGILLMSEEEIENGKRGKHIERSIF